MELEASLEVHKYERTERDPINVGWTAWSEDIRDGIENLLMICENQAVVQIKYEALSVIRPMMGELRRIKVLLDEMGLQEGTKWIPSLEKRFSDALSRRFHRAEIKIHKKLRRSVLDGMEEPMNGFRRRPKGLHPLYLLREMFRKLRFLWEKDEVQLILPPVDLILVTVHKLRVSKTPAILLIPDFPRKKWHQVAINLVDKVELMRY